MRSTTPREKFRAVLSGERCVHPGSVYDPISARIAEDLGFEVGMFAGSVASMAVLGAPDLIVLTLSEFADQARRICRAGSLPLMVDADHGYGNALNVKRTVEELEVAGISGLSIEDTVLPRPFGSGGKTELLSIEEGVGKMKAAVAGRSDPGLCIFGRTSAAGITGTEDCIARVKAYQDTGVDAIFLVGVKDRAQLEAIAAETRLPLMLGGAGKAMMDKDYLASQGVRICLQGHQPFAAGVQAVYATLKALRDGVAPADLPGVASAELMKQVTRGDDYDRWTRDFLD
ncbi:oxaloacetate decarboxylase [Thalassobaculum fulvum]|uniref:Oxaloacetate decarboxylase n=1 Tax=Thalassobaculum fulvum TaxID=1633335 RepID=A0A919CNK0_9PROT|nr:isocitrate lyase/PEP mutase family protein [Thalassobaculum fulvum]GHD44236.1 oxaloacetate decarboxylase [Thalassobaculum fulvum]